MKDEFAPVSPGEMLKEEFFGRIRPVAESAREGHRYFSESDRRDRPQPSSDHC